MELEDGVDLIDLLVGKPSLPLPMKIEAISAEDREVRRKHADSLKQHWSAENEKRDFVRMANSFDEAVGGLDIITGAYRLLATGEKGCKTQVEALVQLNQVIEDLQRAQDVARGILVLHWMGDHDEIPQDMRDYFTDYLLAMGGNAQERRMRDFIGKSVNSLFGGAPKS